MFEETFAGSNPALCTNIFHEKSCKFVPLLLLISTKMAKNYTVQLAFKGSKDFIFLTRNAVKNWISKKVL